MIFYRKGYKAQLATTAQFFVPVELWPPETVDTEFIRLDQDGALIIRKGYAWDFASGPTIDIPIKKMATPSLVHDAFCQLHRQGHLKDVPNARKHADRYFYVLLRERKFWWPRARLWYRGVRLGAKMNQQVPKTILEAP